MLVIYLKNHAADSFSILPFCGYQNPHLGDLVARFCAYLCELLYKESVWAMVLFFYITQYQLLLTVNYNKKSWNETGLYLPLYLKEQA